MTPESTFTGQAEALWQALQPVWPGLSVEILPEVASTNSLLLARSSATEPCLLVAQRQTQGRGRLGRAWHSQEGASLTFSLAVPLTPVRWDGLSLAVGLALAEALQPIAASAPRLMLKWPNDLWLVDGAAQHGRKLGGILIETTARRQQRWCVVGVGLNVAAAAAQQGQEATPLSHGYAAVQEILPGISPPQVLAQVALPLARALRRFEQQGFAPLAPAYAHRDLLKGQAVVAQLAPLRHGMALGVDEHGALLLQTTDGPVQRIASGEVSVRLQPVHPPEVV